ncbi:DNA-binding transcriptional regulator, MarR family [Nocardioides scoriae]|uniref:DNA-binding transcriptional regulator, MarR family n=1 Tax=Nocardioides scoriae TaxID=642780 RepID=A0A1H1UAZ8_9ACTN|nr:DNA-binding transcriptional regulator, MarR family [Nocardioides scoriae]
MASPQDQTSAFVTASRALLSLAVRTIAEAPVEVTLAQHRVLVLLSARGDQPVGDIADGLGVNPSNATRICDRLQRLNLISRTRSEQDRRVVVISLSPQGADLVRAVTARRHVEVEKVLDRMTPEQTAQVVQALEVFNRAAGEIEDPDWATPPW